MRYRLFTQEYRNSQKSSRVLRTAPCDCMTEPETGCFCSISCTRGSIPRILRMRPVGLFRRIFGEYSVSPHPPYNPFSYPVCGVRLLMVKPLFHLFWWNDRQMNENHFPCGKVVPQITKPLFHVGTSCWQKCRGSSLLCKLLFVHYLAPSYIRTAS